jgi:hypothetical protein
MCNGICSRKCDSRPAGSHACVITALGHLPWWLTCLCHRMVVTLHVLITCMCHHSTGAPSMVDHMPVPSHGCETSHADHLHVSSQYWGTKHGGSHACAITWLWHFACWSPACVITVLGHHAWPIMCQDNLDTQSLTVKTGYVAFTSIVLPLVSQSCDCAATAELSLNNCPLGYKLNTQLPSHSTCEMQEWMLVSRAIILTHCGPVFFTLYLS